MKASPELAGAFACTALAVVFAFVTAQCEQTDDVSERVVRVEADFSVASTRHGVKKRNPDGTTSTFDETIVEAVYEIGGKTYRHSISEQYAKSVVKTLPGRGTILVDPRDPTKPPRMKPAGLAGAPLLACILSALAGVALFVAAWRHRKRAA